MKTILTLLCACTALCVHAQQMSNIESIEYDPVNERFLVSNGSSVIEVDGNGDEVAFLPGDAEADYGMEVMNGLLFAVVGTSVRAFELTSGIQQMSVTVPDAQFLNGLASDGVSRLWVSDFGAKKIHEIDVSDLLDPVVTTIVDNTVSTPNGIVYDGANNRLVFVSWGGSAPIKAIDLSDYSVSTITPTTLGSCDGVDHDGNGNFYVSSWSPVPKITRFYNDFSANETITITGLSSPADICYAVENDTLAIPNSGNNTVLYIGFGEASVDEGSAEPFSIRASPNPSSGPVVVSYTLPLAGEVQFEILDMQGRVVHSYFDKTLGPGRHKVVIDTSAFPSAVYICRVHWNGETRSIQLVR